MSLNYDDVVRTGLAKQVADEIRAAILDGRLKIEERLPSEDELAKRFGISRPTVREALKRLAAQNLIRSRRGPSGGNFVSRPDPEGLSKAITGAATLMVGVGAFDVDELVTARLETESICVRLAAGSRTEADIAAMAAEIELQRKRSMSGEEFCASDVRFHRALVDATQNGPLRLMMYTVIESFIPITNMLTYGLYERRGAADSHESILAAIREQDADRAAERLRDHLTGMRVVLAQALERRAEKSAAGKPAA
ncbi:FadR/GntR family transcriptional regulator [Mesorhizobium sp. CN2-181]|uniref:FadR/GntR family transcriptional regulator n=1 Tax=Mesorhizobium yinganensis TaxID=3157707 RepID=UPI0032B86117